MYTIWPASEEALRISPSVSSRIGFSPLLPVSSSAFFTVERVIDILGKGFSGNIMNQLYRNISSLTMEVILLYCFALNLGVLIYEDYISPAFRTLQR